MILRDILKEIRVLNSQLLRTLEYNFQIIKYLIRIPDCHPTLKYPYKFKPQSQYTDAKPRYHLPKCKSLADDF